MISWAHRKKPNFQHDATRIPHRPEIEPKSLEWPTAPLTEPLKINFDWACAKNPIRDSWKTLAVLRVALTASPASSPPFNLRTKTHPNSKTNQTNGSILVNSNQALYYYLAFKNETKFYGKYILLCALMKSTENEQHFLAGNHSMAAARRRSSRSTSHIHPNHR